MDLDIIDLRQRLAPAEGFGPVWTQSSDDLNVNLLRFAAGQGVPAHRNDEVDVLVLALEGTGVVEVDGTPHAIGAGQLCLIPKGLTRSIRSAGGSFAYVTCHRRRGGLMPV